MLALEHEYVRVRVELHRLERARRRRQLDERELDLAALDELVQLEVALGLRGPQLDARPRGSEAVHQTRKDPDADRLRDADAERARRALCQ